MPIGISGDAVTAERAAREQTLEYLQCASVVFLALPDSVLNTVEDGLTTAISFAEGKIVWIEAEIISLNILLAPLLAKRVAINNILAAVQSQTSIVSSSIASGCPPLGQITEVVDDTVSQQTARVRRLMNAIDYSQGLRLEYQNHKDLINRQINFMKRVRSLVQGIKAARAAVITVVNIKPSI